MTIALKSAEAAIRALSGLSGHEMFNAMSERGDHLFTKHMSKTEAQKAAGAEGSAQGYFKKIGTKPVGNLASYKDLTPREKRHIVVGATGAKAQLPAKPQAKNFGGKGFQVQMTRNIDMADFAALIGKVINTAPVKYAKTTGLPDRRFLYITAIPKDFVGRSIDAGGIKAKDLDYAVLLVDAGGGNPFLVTLYPADQNYVNGRQALT